MEISKFKDDGGLGRARMQRWKVATFIRSGCLRERDANPLDVIDFLVDDHGVFFEEVFRVVVRNGQF